MFCVAHMTLVTTMAGIHVHISEQTRLNTHYHNLLLLQVITTITTVFSKQKSAQHYHTNITYFQSVDFEHEILLNTFFLHISRLLLRGFPFIFDCSAENHQEQRSKVFQLTVDSTEQEDPGAPGVVGHLHAEVTRKVTAHCRCR